MINICELCDNCVMRLLEDVQYAHTSDSPKRHVTSKCEGDTSFIIKNSHETFLRSTSRLSRVGL